MQTMTDPSRTMVPVTMTTAMGNLMDRWWGELAFLTAEDVARIWTEERRRLNGVDAPAVRKQTVWAYLQWSKPMLGSEPGRYAKFPVPPPVPGRSRSLIWVPKAGQTIDDLVAELRAWWTERPMQTRGPDGTFTPRHGGDADPELLHRPGEQ